MGIFDGSNGLLGQWFGGNNPGVGLLSQPGVMPANPAAGFPFLPQQSLFGDTGTMGLIGRALRGAVAGSSAGLGYTGWGGFGAGVLAATQAARQRQGFQMQNMLAGQEFNQGTQAIASGNLDIGQKLRNFNIWDRAINPNHVDLSYNDLQDPQKLSQVMNFSPGQQSGTAQPGQEPVGQGGMQGPYAQAPVNGSAPAAPLGQSGQSQPQSNDILANSFAQYHYGMTPQQWARLGMATQNQGMVDEAMKFDSSIITATKQAETRGGPPEQIRQGSVALDPITHQPIFQTPIAQQGINDQGQQTINYVTPAIPQGNVNGSGGMNGNNPGNIRPVGTGPGGGFRNYPDLGSGITGVLGNLNSYGKLGLNTVSKIVSTWAPPNENDTQAYIADVAKQTGLDPNAPLNMNDPKTLTRLALAITNHEQGTPAPALTGGETAGGTVTGLSPFQTKRQGQFADTTNSFENGITQSYIPEQRIMAIMKAMKSFQSGTWATDKAEIVASFKGLGFDVPANILSAPPAEVQIALKNNFQSAIAQMQTFSSQPAAVSLSEAQKNFANPELQPEANLAIGAQAIGTIRWQRDMAVALQKSHLNGSQDPNEFAANWAVTHPLQGYVDKAEKDIGPLKGAAGSSTTPTATGAITKTWQFDSTGKLVPVQ